MRSWTNSPERTFASREQAAMWKCWFLTFKAAVEFTKGAPYVPSESIIREALSFAETAIIDVDSIPSEGGEMGEFAEQAIQDSGEGEHRPTNARRLSRDTAGHVFPVRFARQAEYEIDRIVSDLECGEGEGE